MKAELVNIFIKSAVEVFKRELNVDLARKDLAKKNAPVPGLPVSILFGITGALKGQVVYSMDEAFARRVCRAMLPGRPEEEVEEMERSAVSELANIITGQATIALAGENDKIFLTPPAVLLASDLTFDFLKTPTIVLTLASIIGELEINIALQDEE